MPDLCIRGDGQPVLQVFLGEALCKDHLVAALDTWARTHPPPTPGGRYLVHYRSWAIDGRGFTAAVAAEAVRAGWALPLVEPNDRDAENAFRMLWAGPEYAGTWMDRAGVVRDKREVTMRRVTA